MRPQPDRLSGVFFTQPNDARIELWGDEVEKVSTFDPITGDEWKVLDRLTVYPKSHFVMPRPRIEAAVETIKAELAGWEVVLEQQGRSVFFKLMVDLY